MDAPFDLSWADLNDLADKVAAAVEDVPATGVYPILRGGAVPATMLTHRLDLPIVDDPVGALVVDDIADSGATMARYTDVGAAALVAYVTKGDHPAVHSALNLPSDRWVVFPWEVHDVAPAADNVSRLLEALGEDPTRPGLIDTPARVVGALTEMTSGRHIDVDELLSRTFDEPAGHSVVLHNVEFVSTCEHHLLPFRGTVSLGYAPDQHVVGLSKLARLVDAYARRLQVQERMTEQIADALAAAPGLATGVIVTASGVHSCMTSRGVRKHAVMQTTSTRGDVPEILTSTVLNGHAYA